MGHQSTPEHSHPQQEPQTPPLVISSPVSSSQGSKDKPKSASRPRKFLPQPIETTSRTSAPDRSGSTGVVHAVGPSNGPNIELQQDKRSARRKFLPEPIETTKSSNHAPSLQTPAQPRAHDASAGPRRFKPELIETVRQSIGGRVEAPVNRFENDNGYLQASVHDPRLVPRQETYPRPSESKFSYASLLRRQEGRRHSFRVPELPPIPSNSSESSSDSSSSSPRPAKTSFQSISPVHAHSLKGDSDETLSEYFLALAARSAHRQLKEQALAAFPNEQAYEPVDHFAVDDEDNGSEGEPWSYPQAYHIKSRRQSSADLSWELEYMRQHKEEAEQRLRIMIATGKPLFESMQSNPAPLKNDRSPPMLGSDIVIPRSQSPEGTMCEKPHAGGDSPTADDQCTGCGGLWCASKHTDRGRGSGLWKGTCQRNEPGGVGSGTSMGTANSRVSSNGVSVTKARSLDLPNVQKRRVNTCRPRQTATSLSPNVLDEFDDSFVTQIYNYISLGYPCVARSYDDELSRISGITVQELRCDDLRTDARGYVVAPDGNSPVACSRWKALRLYIQDWALHQPHMGEDDESAWGMPERKGSWAI
ncbi:hypothetical protein N7468_000109 [Penicillium chermesinum]|uniref:Uncharacterized protein n=1 Tax=Penicillium chermesinum TaxID=63820 RepID=A0A9W9TY22_9EURO|nr:uncharacterized protein N7468_000109 [Penicillium chermesinum]KAJ5248658.1 hypothetical protein N7468_000109 [Penicillium chermesinum]KAJ6150766.1 hypothetical protein N7470_007360 [Penicillium chermesinum]